MTDRTRLVEDLREIAGEYLANDDAHEILMQAANDDAHEILMQAAKELARMDELERDGRAIASARDEWLDSKEGAKCGVGVTSGVYLRNRLECAFIAGWNAALAHSTDEAAKGKTDE